MDFSEAFDFFDDILDEDGDIDMWKTAYRNEDLASQLVIPAIKIQDFFWEWVNSINLYSASAKEDFLKLINNGDRFLTFNYTETLEVLYGIHEDDICHIHGKQYEEIFFGHGNMEDYYDIYMQSHIGSQDGLSNIDRQLRKDTCRALRENIDFFDGLNNADITHIYSYGFSFNEVDSIYMKEICKSIKTEDITWYFNDYNINEVGRYMIHLKECGFNGNFNIFRIN